MLASSSAETFVRHASDRARSAKFESDRSTWRILAPALAAAALIAIGVFWFVAPTSQGPSDLAWRGHAPTVDIYLKRESDISKLGDRVPRAGDELRYGITMPPGTTGHAAVFALESERIQPLLPPDSERAPHRTSESAVLSGSIEITEGDRPFVLVLVVRPDDYQIPAVVRELEAAAERGDLQQVDGVVHQLHVSP